MHSVFTSLGKPGPDFSGSENRLRILELLHTQCDNLSYVPHESSNITIQKFGKYQSDKTVEVKKEI